MILESHKEKLWQEISMYETNYFNSSSHYIKNSMHGSFQYISKILFTLELFGTISRYFELISTSVFTNKLQQ